jgi:hypothetical protein
VSEVLFEDTFNVQANDWSTLENDYSRRGYRNGEYVMEVTDGQWLIWTTPDMDTVSDVRVAVTINAADAGDATFGVVCNFVDNEAFYYIGFGADGYYALVRTEGEDDIFLNTDENLWVHSDQITEFNDSYELEVECGGDGALRLIVDGVTIDEVVDDTYTEGSVGFFVQSFEQLPVAVGFDDLVITTLTE